MSAAASDNQALYLRFHGRIIDSLGIQMYQSPVAAIAELVANAWDADATEVDVMLPDHLGEDAEIVVADNGTGITFGECQDCYLNVGRNRRIEEGRNRTPNGLPLLGRKGIGRTGSPQASGWSTPAAGGARVNEGRTGAEGAMADELLQDLPRDLPTFVKRFGTDAKCRAYLVRARWPAGFRCTGCGHDQAWSHKKRLIEECTACGKQHSLLAGTIFEQTKLVLRPA